MGLSTENQKALLLQLHNSIESSANLMSGDILQGRTDRLINYPPNGGLTEEEVSAIKKLEGDEILRSALRKIIASSISDTVFDFLNLIDGTTDPDYGDWGGVSLQDIDEDHTGPDAFLHDSFFDTYWDWREKRKANFKLDILED